MKMWIISLATFALLVPIGSASAKGGSHTSAGSHSVRGYVTKKGTYVAPHRATNPDGTKSNNWSHKGNVNPYTGKEGTKSN